MINNIENIKRRDIVDYLLVFLLIALSGFPFFTAKRLYLIIGFLFAVYIFISRRKKINEFYLVTIFILLFVVIFQTYIFDYFDVKTQIGLFIRWTFPFVVVIVVGKKLAEYYINVIYYLAIISFIFFIPSILIPGFEKFLLQKCAPIFNQAVSEGSMYSYNPNILVYTIKTDAGIRFSNYFRNSGPFWEPGAFAGYTIIALMFNMILTSTLKNKKNITFLLAIASTFSTAGFLGVSVLLFSYFLILNKNKNGWFLAPVIVLLAFTSFTNVKIFNYKITSEMERLIKGDTSVKRSRVVSALVDLKDINKHPVIGRGRNDIMRYGSNANTWRKHRNNGVTDFAVKYGIPFFLFYFYFIYCSIKKLLIDTGQNQYFAIYALAVIFIIGSAETYFQQSFFISMFYMHLTFNKRVRAFFRDIKVTTNNKSAARCVNP